MTKLIIAGSRSITNKDFVFISIDEYIKHTEVTQIISGGAKGPDTFAIEYAETNNITLVVVPALWDRYGKGAGFKRNMRMAHLGDALLVFWDGRSPGTKNMMQWMNRLNKPITSKYIDAAV